MQSQRIAILGSTGSIGKQTLDLCRRFPETFIPEVLTANCQVDELIAQAIEFKPNAVVIRQESGYEKLRDALTGSDTKVFCGEQSITDWSASSSVDTVLVSLVGFAGLKPALAAAKKGKRIALATKEALVVAGELLTRSVIENKALMLPVDSEHSAIFQCLQGESPTSVEKLILTASGGPFRGFTIKQMQNVELSDALNHPSWKMGKKITIDSSTLMNKGFEMIEAHWLFGIEPAKIEVVVHPQSIIHSMVQFIDGSIKAQMGLPDMRLPIQYALSWPQRLENNLQRTDFFELRNLSFEKPDPTVFRHLQMAYDASEAGGTAPCILNAANEVAVDSFIKGKIRYNAMQEIIDFGLQEIQTEKIESLGQLTECDRRTREICINRINNQ